MKSMLFAALAVLSVTACGPRMGSPTMASSQPPVSPAPGAVPIVAPADAAAHQMPWGLANVPVYRDPSPAASRRGGGDGGGGGR